MTRDDLNRKLCAVITTLADVPMAPETTLYLGLGSNMEEWETVKTVLLAGKLATCDCNEVRITEAGRAMAAKINKAMGVRTL
jgi:hypothetical protein